MRAICGCTSRRSLAAWERIPKRRRLNEGADIVIATPGRLLDLMGRRYGNFSNLHSWCWMRPTACWTWVFCLRFATSCAPCRASEQTLMFSATFSKEIESLTHQFQHSPKVVQIGRRANPAATVTQLVYESAARFEAEPAAASLARSLPP